jgi:hypothetical protein
MRTVVGFATWLRPPAQAEDGAAPDRATVISASPHALHRRAEAVAGP